jgi:hypothetical protein
MKLNIVVRLCINSPAHVVSQIKNVNFLRKLHSLPAAKSWRSGAAAVWECN